MQGQQEKARARFTLHSLGVVQANGTLIRDSPHLLERIKNFEPSAQARLEKALATYDEFQSGKTPFRIVVVGSQGVGKSSFVNNFLPGGRQPLLPSQMGGRAVTLAPIVLTYGETYSLNVVSPSFSRDLVVSQEDGLFQALQALQGKLQDLSRNNQVSRVRNDLKKLAEHQEEVDKLEEKLARAKVEKSKKKIKAELEELSRSRPKCELDLDREVVEKQPLERIVVTLPNETFKGVEIVDCPGYADKEHDARLISPMLRDAHCLAVVAARLPSRLEYYEALERNCMASSLLVVWRWPDESEELRKKSLLDAPVLMEQAYQRRFIEERHLPFQAEQLIRCSSMACLMTEFDSPKLDWVVKAREHHLEKLAEWLVVCLNVVEQPLPRPPPSSLLADQVGLLLEFRRIIQTVVAFHEPTRLYNLTRGKTKLSSLILEQITRSCRDMVFSLIAQSTAPEKQALLQVSMKLDSFSLPPLPNNIQGLLTEEMSKIWSKDVILNIAVRREQIGRDKSDQARLDSDRLCGEYATFVELTLKEWFLLFVRQTQSLVC